MFEILIRETNVATSIWIYTKSCCTVLLVGLYIAYMVQFHIVVLEPGCIPVLEHCGILVLVLGGIDFWECFGNRCCSGECPGMLFREWTLWKRNDKLALGRCYKRFHRLYCTLLYRMCYKSLQPQCYILPFER